MTEIQIVKDLRDTAALATKGSENPFEERKKAIEWKAADEIERLQKEIGRAYRAISGLYLQAKKLTPPDNTLLAYHGPTIGAAIRFVDEDGVLDGSEYFIGKPVEVLHEVLMRRA